MSRWARAGGRTRAWVAAAAMLFVGSAGVSIAQAESFRGVGRPATPDEIKAWDIDVRPDFQGLPAGSGSVRLGMEVWEGKCASCHGYFGESSEVFTPIVGGTTTEDIRRGRVANLARPDFPQRTTLMKLATVSTLWDYIHRAMPWTNPKTLTVEEVYGVVGYILHLGDMVPEDFVLSNHNIAEVQARMPNRDGMSIRHGLADVRGKPDVRNVACMTNCAPSVKVTSSLPEFARGTHGNLMEQNRTIGPVRGVETTPQARPGPN